MTLPLCSDRIIISISHVCILQVMFQYHYSKCWPLDDSKATLPLRKQYLSLTCGIHFSEEITIPYATLNVTEDTEICCLMLSTSNYLSVVSEFGSQARDGRRTLRFSSFTPTGYFSVCTLNCDTLWVWYFCSRIVNSYLNTGREGEYPSRES